MVTHTDSLLLCNIGLCKLEVYLRWPGRGRLRGGLGGVGGGMKIAFIYIMTLLNRVSQLPVTVSSRLD